MPESLTHIPNEDYDCATHGRPWLAWPRGCPDARRQLLADYKINWRPDPHLLDLVEYLGGQLVDAARATDSDRAALVKQFLGWLRMPPPTNGAGVRNRGHFEE